MAFTKLLRALVLASVMIGPAWAADDRLGVPGPIDFGETRYDLAFVFEPQPGYVKQEYLPNGEAADTYRSMVLVEFLAGDLTAADVARRQIGMLEERRGTDPFVNYDILMSSDKSSIVLDFLLSGLQEDGRRIVEWNGYRYMRSTDAEGDTGTLLTGISRRAYGDDITSFVENLNDVRNADIASLVALEITPETVE